MVTSQEFKETADAIRKSGKAKFIGFSTHNKDRAPIIEAAAKAGYIDAIMLQYRPWLDKDSPLNKALDVCWKKEIGLISMKQIAGNGFGDKPRGDILKEVAEKVPMLVERKLSPFQGLLHAIWTDERISAACVSMKNTDHVRENADAARRYEPLKQADIHQLRDVFLAIGPDAVRRLRRPLLVRRRHDRRARQPDPVPDLPPAARRPHPGSPRIRRAFTGSPRLDRCRPRSRPGRMPRQAQLRQALARSRAAFGMNRG